MIFTITRYLKQPVQKIWYCRSIPDVWTDRVFKTQRWRHNSISWPISVRKKESDIKPKWRLEIILIIPLLVYKRSKNLFTLSHFDTCKHKIFMGSGCFAMILIILWSLVFQCNKHNSYWCIWQYQDKQTALGGHGMDRETNMARACGLGHIRFPVHAINPRAVRISWYCPIHQ